MPDSSHIDASPNGFLPDFCGLPVLFAVVVVGELLAFIIALAPVSSPDRWIDLAMVSLFIQWVSLSSLALLCLMRRLLDRIPPLAGGILSYAVVVGLTLLFSELSFRFMGGTSLAIDHVGLLLRNTSIGGIIAAVVLRYLYLQAEWRGHLESEAQARIQALQSRIRPHFLFNSMNTIASLTRSRPAVAEQVVEDLAALFRVSLADAQLTVSLAEELDVCRRYIAIERLRLGERLSVDWQLGQAPQDARLPSLILQPLLENAVYHGVEPDAEGGWIRVRVELRVDDLNIEVRNSCPADGSASHRSGNRMALDNIRQRLRAHFGARAKVEADRVGDEFYTTLRMPYQQGDGA